VTARSLEAQVEPSLRAGVQALQLALSEVQIQQLLEYGQLLQKWSRIYNLTALRSPSEIVTHHLLDSLAVISPLRRKTEAGAGRLLDVGSGAGLPGVAIAIACPDIHVTCVDAVAKKAAFVGQAAGALQLVNLRGIHSRVESCSGQYDIVTSRAFASLSDFVELTRHLLAPGGIWMAMKGKNPTEELRELPSDVEVFHVEQLEVPGLDAERCLIWIRPRGA